MLVTAGLQQACTPHGHHMSGNPIVTILKQSHTSDAAVMTERDKWHHIAVGAHLDGHPRLSRPDARGRWVHPGDALLHACMQHLHYLSLFQLSGKLHLACNNVLYAFVCCQLASDTSNATSTVVGSVICWECTQSEISNSMRKRCT